MKILMGLLLAGSFGMCLIPSHSSVMKQSVRDANNDEAEEIDTSKPVQLKIHEYTDWPDNEPYFASHQYISMNHIGDIKSIWNSYRGDGIKVAVIDNGIHKAHEDLWRGSNCILSNDSAAFTTGNGAVYPVSEYGWGAIEANNEKELHGLATTATIAATVGGYGTTGIAPNVEVIFCKSDLYTDSNRNAIKWAVDHGAQVINMSFGGQHDRGFMQDGVNYAYEHGVICVASAGNEATTEMTCPASCTHVVGVGALARDSNYIKANYSNWNANFDPLGHNVDCVAPGTVYTASDCYGESHYSEANGTSFSGPIVAGAAALYKQKYPTANQDDFERDLALSCVDIGDPGEDLIYGHGRIDIGALLNVGAYDDNVDYQKTNTTTKNEDATIIEWNDASNWYFRTIHLWGLNYFEGYTHNDFSNYLTISTGARVESTNYVKESDVAQWCFTSNKPNGGDYLINLGGTDTVHQLVLPWWVTNGFYQFVNNSNWTNESGNYIYSGDSHYKSKLSHTITNGADSGVSITEGATYDFKAVKVTRKLLNKNMSVIETVDNFETCMYDFLRNSMLTNEAIQLDGYSVSKWYLDSACKDAFFDQIIRKDITLYAIRYELNGSYYFQSQDWGDNMYAYEYFVDSNGTVHEPLGAWPGTKLNALDGVTYDGRGVWKGSIFIENTVDCKVIFNNNSTLQTEDITMMTNVYVFYKDAYNEQPAGFYKDTGAYKVVQLIDSIRDSMKQITEEGSIKSDSICGFTQSQRTDYLTKYANIEANYKDKFDNATIYTYKSNTNDRENVSMKAIMDQLAGYNYGSSSKSITISSVDSSLLLITLATISSLMLIGTLVIKRKKLLNNNH